MNRDQILHNLQDVRDRIESATRRAGRDPAAVRLVAVTKRNPADWIRPLVESDAVDLGENYPQELWSKAEALADLPIRWHLIGHLQRNKAKRVLRTVTLIHAVDSLRLLRDLDSLAAEMGDTMIPPVCLQVNASGEASKHGWSPAGIGEDAEAIVSCRRIPIVGLMTMAAFDADPASSRPAFSFLREVRDDLRRRTGLSLPELSMGMSNDFEVAIEEGATLVRVGSALFEGVST